MTFQSSILAGMTLIREAIQSQNYQQGVEGWAINADGSAEFSDIVIRGSGSADPVVVGPAGLPQVIIRTTPTNGVIVFPTNRAIELNAATVNSAVVDPDDADERSELELTGPTVTGATDGVRVVLRSQPQDGSLPAEFSVQNRDGSATYFVVDETEVRVVEMRIDSRQLAATDPVLTGYVTTDAADRVVILASGEIQWGPGNAARDVRLYREAASVLATDDIVRVYRALTTDNALSVRVVGDTASRLFVNADGNHNWGPGGASAADTNLYRQGVGELKTDNSFTVDENLLVGGTSHLIGNVTVDGSVTADNIRRGTAQTPAPGGAPAQTSVAVVFADAMPAVPNVVLTPNSGAGNLNTTNIRWAVTGVSATGFTVNCWRDTNFATNFEYIAIS